MKTTIFWLSILTGLLVAAGCGPKTPPPNVVVVMVDTLRADYLGCYGYDNDLSPNIDRLGKAGVRFEDVYAASPWTTPSVASVTTGKYPDEVGIRDLQDGLPRRVTTVAELLKKGGYQTHAVVSNALAGPDYGHDQGYDSMFCEGYKDMPNGGRPRFTADQVTDKALTVVDQALKSPEQPFFLYVHYTDPHDPYMPPASWLETYLEDRDALEDDYMLKQGYRHEEPDEAIVEILKASYEAEIAFMDHHLGRLLDRLPPDTLVIFTGDHGEEFLDHGMFLHGHSLYQELLSVPLIVKGPLVTADTVLEHPVSHVDITPTILDYANLPHEEGFSGRSLRPELTGEDLDPEPRILFSVLENEKVHRVAAREGAWKLQLQLRHTTDRFIVSLTNLDDDPMEEENIAGENEEIVSRILSAMQARAKHLMEAEAAGDAVLEKREEELRALGYID